MYCCISFFFFFQAEDGIRDGTVTGVQTCALPIFGILSDGQPVEEHPPEDDDDEGNDVGEDRPLDEELGDHGAAFFAGRDGRAPCAGGGSPPSRSGVTCRPGAAFRRPLTITHSPPVRPLSMTRWLSTAEPVVTLRRSTTFLSLTTNTYAPCWSCPMAASGIRSVVRRS